MQINVDLLTCIETILNDILNDNDIIDVFKLSAQNSQLLNLLKKTV